MVKASVLTQWEANLKKLAGEMPTLSMLNLDICNLSCAHPVWGIGAAEALTVQKASTKAKLLVQHYLLFYSRTAGANYGRPCPLCKLEAESMKHFLLDCKSLEDTRGRHMQKTNRQSLPVVPG